MSKALLLIGGNIGNRMQNLDQAIKMVNSNIGKVYKVSSIYETEPWGFKCDQAFLNQVIGVETKLSPRETLNEALHIETKMGRTRNNSSYEPRPIDIDILMIDSIVYHDSKLQIPHPRMHERRFALIPLAEIAGDIKHPVFDESIDDLMLKCSDSLQVKKISSNTGYEI